MGLLTREKYKEYINKLSPGNNIHIPQWSEPVYICPRCGGGMRKTCGHAGV